MSQENVEIVRQGFDAWEAAWNSGTDDLGALLMIFDPDLVTRRLAPMPDPGEWHGLEGMLTVLTEWTDTFDEFTMRGEEYTDAGDQVIGHRGLEPAANRHHRLLLAVLDQASLALRHVVLRDAQHDVVADRRARLRRTPARVLRHQPHDVAADRGLQRGRPDFRVVGGARHSRPLVPFPSPSRPRAKQRETIRTPRTASATSR